MIPQRAWEGDEWKHQTYEDPDDPPLTRHEAQQFADELRLQNKITQKQWWRITDALSDPETKDYEGLFEEI